MSEDGLHGNALVELAMFAGSFVGLAIVCDDHMVIALETLCVRWNVSLLLVPQRLRPAAPAHHQLTARAHALRACRFPRM